MAMFRLEVLQKQLSVMRQAQPQQEEEPVAPRLAPPSPIPLAILEAPVAMESVALTPSTEAAPVEPPEPRPPARPPPPPAVPFEWEKWIGVRGAAVLGGIVFAMAGLFLFKYSIAQGWVSPTIRVMGAVLAGLGGLIASQRLRERYEITGQALGGGGIVVLYAATWAAKALYDLIGVPVAFVLMVLITAVAGVFAVRQNNPLMLSTGQNAPGALFTYVFLLDVALLAIAWLQKWKSVAALSARRRTSRFPSMVRRAVKTRTSSSSSTRAMRR